MAARSALTLMDGRQISPPPPRTDEEAAAAAAPEQLRLLQKVQTVTTQLSEKLLADFNPRECKFRHQTTN